MKQHITKDQLNELTLEQKENLFKSLFPKVYDRPDRHGTIWKAYDINNEYLTIGHMIEFLDERITGDLDLQIWINGAGSSIWTGIGRQETKYGGGESVELCDALWEAVKEVLNKSSEL